MKKRMNSLICLTTAVCLLPVILSAVLYSRLPDQIAIHFNSAGEPDNYAPKALAAFGIPVMMAVLNVITHLVLDADPKRANASAMMKLMGKWLVPLLTVVMMPVTLFIAMGADIPIQTIVPAFVGLVIVACGNYLPKCRQNYTVGIKLPWTLNSEENWNKTHHMAGYLWIGAGILMILAGFWGWNWLAVVGFIGVLCVAAPAIYSYRLYKAGI